MTAGHDLALTLRRAHLAIHRQTSALLSPLGVTADQFVLLAILDDEDGINQQEVARRAGSDASTVGAMLVRMEGNGLVIRQPDQIDGRTRRVLITPKGREVYGRLSVEVTGLHEAIMAPFEGRETRALAGSLNQVIRAMKRWERDNQFVEVVSGDSTDQQ